MRWMMLLPICLISISCASDPQPLQRTTAGTNIMSKPDAWLGAQPMRPPTPAPSNSATAKQSARQPINASSSSKKDPSLGPPKDAQFTLYCADYTGPSHVEVANRMKQELSANGGLRGWYIIHQEDRSTLFHGYYKDVNDAAIKRDRAAIEALQDQQGNRVVRAAIAVSVDAPDPIAPPEWNLQNVRNGELDTKHYWTLQIAAYQGSPERKQYAVEAVRAARQQGVEAYYFHGPSISSVCIGVWPLEALKRPSQEDVSPEGTNPDQQMLITPGGLVTADQQSNNKLMPQKLVDKGRREGIKYVPRQIEVLDPTLRQAMQTFPQHYINGAAEGVNVNGKIAPKESIIVLVPATGATASLPAPPPPPTEAVRQLQPEPQAPSSGGGRLKSIGK